TYRLDRWANLFAVRDPQKGWLRSPSNGGKAKPNPNRLRLEAKMAKAKVAKPKKVLSPEERAKRNLQRRHRREIREVFSAVGFQRVEGASDKEFTYDGVT